MNKFYLYLLINIFQPPLQNVSVVAWGLSLERPVMIKYGIKTIRTLFGPNLSVDFVKQGPIFMIKPAEEEEKEKAKDAPKRS